MRDRYIDLIEQTYYFFRKMLLMWRKIGLRFHKIDLKHVIENHGAPLTITYLPKIGENINHVPAAGFKKRLSVGYNGYYYYCYCTKS